VPDSSSIAEIVSALDTISRQTGLQLVGIAVQGGSRGGDNEVSSNLTIPVQLVGGYESLAAFLNSVEQNLRLLDVISVSISPDTNNPALLHFDLQLFAYFVK
jgi:Tfp pilus assembly protein PilO